jgi:branched-subunit amino acid aminotransferase/4-amino-4-deoxychorismate lyase
MNEKDQVAEVTSANIFWVRKGKLYTPPLSAGCLEGITREWVFKTARQARLKVFEKNERLASMLRAEEVFISSSLKLIIGVSEIAVGNRRYKVKPGEVTALLKQRLDDYVGR